MYEERARNPYEGGSSLGWRRKVGTDMTQRDMLLSGDDGAVAGDDARAVLQPLDGEVMRSGQSI
jgi:hypothetical protein